MRTSLPRKIAESIVTDSIDGGQLQTGDRLPSVRVMEERYSVSRSTVLGALQLLEHQGKISRRQGQGCFVSDSGENHTLSSVTLIGYISPSSESDLMLRIYQGIERVVRGEEIHILVASSRVDYETERRQVDRMRDAGCGAIVLSPVWRTREQLQNDYLTDIPDDIPIILVDLAVPSQGHTRVVFDNFRAGFDMTEFLLQEGHRRIAFLDLEDDRNAPLEHYAVRERYEGYRRAMHSAGLVQLEERWALPATKWVGGISSSSGELSILLQNWLKRSNQATALIAIDDSIAMQAIKQASELGISIPNGLQITGFDYLTISRSFHPAFPTTDPDFRHAGEIAARLAVQRMRGMEQEKLTYILPVPLRRRRMQHSETKLI